MAGSRVDTRVQGPGGVTPVANQPGVEDLSGNRPNIIRVRVNVKTGEATPLSGGDARAETAAQRALDYVENPNGSITAMDPLSTNRFFSGSGRDDDPPSIN